MSKKPKQRRTKSRRINEWYRRRLEQFDQGWEVIQHDARHRSTIRGTELERLKLRKFILENRRVLFPSVGTREDYCPTGERLRRLRGRLFPAEVRCEDPQQTDE